MPISRSNKSARPNDPRTTSVVRARPNIGITMGDPAGIGPEVTLKALASSKVRGLANFLIIGDGALIYETAKRCRLKVRSPVLDMSNVSQNSFSYGRVRPSFGRASIAYLDKALELAGEGEIDGLVTAPLNKESVRLSGLEDFKGHTEYIAEKTGAKDVAMMFVGGAFKITLVTRHLPLNEVSRNLSVSSISAAIRLTDQYLKKFFNIRKPKIGVAGLNPHAGEGGIFGDEEARLIKPAIRRTSRLVRNIRGPIPPDVIFYECLNKKFDACIAMYHDQALIPFKLLYFKDGVNLTLGLPFIRTSPDHGTAFDIAGKGVADPTSMIEAIRLACRLVKKVK